MEASGQEHQADEEGSYPAWRALMGEGAGNPREDVEKFAALIEQADRGLANAPPEQLSKAPHGLQSYGRVEVVLSRSELNKLFAGDVGVIYCEYDQREEQLRICVEGSGLFKNWREGQRPFNVRGKLLDSSYVMMEKDP